MWFKTSKDRLIEFLQAELTSARQQAEQLHREVAEAQADARDAVRLATQAVELIPQGKDAAKGEPQIVSHPRTLRDQCRQLTADSLKRAREGKNLVAPASVMTAAGPIPMAIAAGKR